MKRAVALAALVVGAHAFAQPVDPMNPTYRNVTVQNLLVSKNYTLTGTAPVIFANSATSTFGIKTSISAANAGATAGTSAISLFPVNALDATDWVLNVGNAANAASLFHLDYAGNGTFAGALAAGTTVTAGGGNGFINSSGGIFQTTASNTPMRLFGNINDAAAATALKISSGVTLTAGSDRFIATFFRDNETNSMARIDSSGGYQELMGTSTGYATGIGLANATTADVTSSGASNLISYTLPANALVVTNRCLRITGWGTALNNANAKTVALVFGSQTLITKQLTPSIANVTWKVQATVCRSGSSTQDIFAEAWNTQGSTVAAADGNTVLYQAARVAGTQTETATIIIKGTTTVATTTDVTMDDLVVEFM